MLVNGQCCVVCVAGLCRVRCFAVLGAAATATGGGRGRSRTVRVAGQPGSDAHMSDEAPAASDRSNDGSDASNPTTPRGKAGPAADASMGTLQPPALEWQHTNRDEWSHELEQVALQARALSIVALHGTLNMSNKDTKQVMDFIMSGDNALTMHNWHLLARFWAGTRGGLWALVGLACRLVYDTQLPSLLVVLRVEMPCVSFFNLRFPCVRSFLFVVMVVPSLPSLSSTDLFPQPPNGF